MKTKSGIKYTKVIMYLYSILLWFAKHLANSDAICRRRSTRR